MEGSRLRQILLLNQRREFKVEATNRFGHISRCQGNFDFLSGIRSMYNIDNMRAGEIAFSMMFE